MAVAGPYTFPVVNDSGLDASQNSIRVLGFSVASQLMLQPSATAGVLEWGTIPAAVTLLATVTSGADTIAWSGGLPAFMTISVGDQVTGSGIPAGTTVTTISAQVTLTEAATSTGSAPATVETVIMVGGTATQGSATVGGLVPPPSISNFRVGQAVAGTGIPAGTTLTQINAITQQITLSASASASATYSGTSPLTFWANVTGAFTSGGTAATISQLTSTDQIAANSAIVSSALGATLQISQIDGIAIALSSAATAGGSNELTFASIQTGTLTTGQSTIPSVGSPATLGAGRPVTGNGIPAGTTIVSIDSSGSIGLSSPATATGSQSLTFAPATGVIPSFDVDQWQSFGFDPSVQTAGLNGARVYFFVVPDSWPATAAQAGFTGYPTNPPAFPYVFAVTGFGVQQANNPPNSPSTTSGYPPFAIVEPTIDPASAGGALHIDVQTVDGFTFPLSLTLQDSQKNQLGQVGQPVPGGSVDRAAIITAFQAAFPSSSPYASLLYGGPDDVDGQYPGILNPGAYLADDSSAGSTLETIWSPVLAQLFAGTNVLNMVGDDGDYYKGTPTTVVTNGQTCNVLQFVGYTDTGMTQANGNTFNIYSPATPDPLAPNSSLSAGYQVFANDGVFNDISSNVMIQQNTGTGPTPAQVALGLQRDIVSALNRGVALQAPGGTTNRTAGDTSYYWAVETNWYPYKTSDTVSTDVQNDFSLFMHTAAVSGTPVFTQPSGAVATPQGLTMGQAYGFAYDEDPVHASPSTGNQPTVPSKFDPAPATTATITITVGAWS
jgi:hypothetical protein